MSAEFLDAVSRLQSVEALLESHSADAKHIQRTLECSGELNAADRAALEIEYRYYFGQCVSLKLEHRGELFS
jgi:hypothetical protein